MAALGQWLDLQPVLEEVASTVFTGRQASGILLPEWFVAAIPNPAVHRTREELIQIAAAAIEVISKLDVGPSGG